MKSLLFLVCLFFILSMSCSQNPSKTLDGKSFQISTWDVNHPEKQDPESLVFKNGLLDSEACHQYGFTAAPYQSIVTNGEWRFTCLMKSPAEGEMFFEGLIKDNNISGTILWKKSGQGDIKYEFKGGLKN